MVDEPRPPEEDLPQEPGPAFHPIFFVAVAGIAGAAGMLAMTGLLWPFLLVGGGIALFVLIQVGIFKLFPPPK